MAKNSYKMRLSVLLGLVLLGICLCLVSNAASEDAVVAKPEGDADKGVDVPVSEEEEDEAVETVGIPELDLSEDEEPMDEEFIEEGDEPEEYEDEPAEGTQKQSLKKKIMHKLKNNKVVNKLQDWWYDLTKTKSDKPLVMPEREASMLKYYDSEDAAAIAADAESAIDEFFKVIADNTMPLAIAGRPDNTVVVHASYDTTTKWVSRRNDDFEVIPVAAPPSVRIERDILVCNSDAPWTMPVLVKNVGAGSYMTKDIEFITLRRSKEDAQRWTPIVFGSFVISPATPVHVGSVGQLHCLEKDNIVEFSHGSPSMVSELPEEETVVELVSMTKLSTDIGLTRIVRARVVEVGTATSYSLVGMVPYYMDDFGITALVEKINTEGVASTECSLIPIPLEGGFRLKCPDLEIEMVSLDRVKQDANALSLPKRGFVMVLDIMKGALSFTSSAMLSSIIGSACDSAVKSGGMSVYAILGYIISGANFGFAFSKLLKKFVQGYIGGTSVRADYLKSMETVVIADKNFNGGPWIDPTDPIVKTSFSIKFQDLGGEQIEIPAASP